MFTHRQSDYRSSACVLYFGEKKTIRRKTKALLETSLKQKREDTGNATIALSHHGSLQQKVQSPVTMSRKDHTMWAIISHLNFISNVK